MEKEVTGREYKMVFILDLEMGKVTDWLSQTRFVEHQQVADYYYLHHQHLAPFDNDLYSSEVIFDFYEY